MGTLDDTQVQDGIRRQLQALSLPELWQSSAYEGVFETSTAWLKLTPSAENDLQKAVLIAGLWGDEAFQLAVEPRSIDTLIDDAQSSVSLGQLTPNDAALVIEQIALPIIEMIEEAHGDQIVLVDIRRGKPTRVASTIHGQLEWNSEPYDFALTVEDGPAFDRLRSQALALAEARALEDFHAEQHDQETHEIEDSYDDFDHTDTAEDADPEIIPFEEAAAERATPPKPANPFEGIDLSRPTNLATLPGHALIGPIYSHPDDLAHLAAGAMLVLDDCARDFIAGLLVGADGRIWKIETDGSRAVVFGEMAAETISTGGNRDHQAIALFIDLGAVKQSNAIPSLADVYDVDTSTSGSAVVIGGNRALAFGDMIRLEDTYGFRVTALEDAA